MYHVAFEVYRGPWFLIMFLPKMGDAGVKTWQNMATPPKGIHNQNKLYTYIYIYTYTLKEHVLMIRYQYHTHYPATMFLLI